MEFIIVCRCGKTCRALRSKRGGELLLEVDAEGSMVRLHQCRALRMIWSAPSGMRLLGSEPTSA